MSNEYRTYDEKNRIVEYALEAIKNRETKKSIQEKFDISNATLNSYIKDYLESGPFEPDDGYDATPTWSGFQYQGKVAIYYSLKTINENITKEAECDSLSCSSYNLEIEKVEDFSINDKDNTARYYSIHQVKAYSSLKDYTYTEAINKVEESVNRHSSNETFPQGFLHIIQPVEFLTTNQKVDIYSYEINGQTQNYCNLAQIEGLVKEEIRKHYSPRIISSDELDIAYLLVLNQVDKLVRERHEEITNFGRKRAEIKPYPFCSICSVFEKELEKDQQYWASNLKNIFIVCYENFTELKLDLLRNMIDNFMQETSAVMEGEDQLTEYIRRLCGYYNTYDTFIYFCKRISPHVKIKERIDALSYHSLLQEDALRGSYFENIDLLIENQAKYTDEGLFILDDKTYLVTCINEDANSRFAKHNIEKIKTDILKNPSNIDTLFEVDTIVTKGIEKQSLRDCKINDLPEPADNKSEDYKDWLKWKKGITHIKEIEIIDQRELLGRLEV